MNISYTYDFYLNVFTPGLSSLRFVIWSIPFTILLHTLVNDRKVKKIFVGLLLILTLILFERSSLKNKFSDLYYDEEVIKITNGYGEVTKIHPNDVRTFLSLTKYFRGVRYCHLFVDMKAGEDYKSLLVDIKEHSCKQDAMTLNKYFGIYLYQY